MACILLSCVLMWQPRGFSEAKGSNVAGAAVGAGTKRRGSMCSALFCSSRFGSLVCSGRLLLATVALMLSSLTPCYHHVISAFLSGVNLPSCHICILARREQLFTWAACRRHQQAATRGGSVLPLLSRAACGSQKQWACLLTASCPTGCCHRFAGGCARGVVSEEPRETECEKTCASPPGCPRALCDAAASWQPYSPTLCGTPTICVCADPPPQA